MFWGVKMTAEHGTAMEFLCIILLFATHVCEREAGFQRLPRIHSDKFRYSRRWSRSVTKKNVMLKKHNVAENQPFCENGSSQTTQDNSEGGSVNEWCAVSPGVPFLATVTQFRNPTHTHGCSEKMVNSYAYDAIRKLQLNLTLNSRLPIPDFLASACFHVWSMALP